MYSPFQADQAARLPACLNHSGIKHRLPFKWLTVAIGCLILFMTACASQGPQRRYYTMVVPTAQPRGESRLTAEVWVREADLAPVINRPQVVYRLTPTELQYYSQEYWADRPARMVTQNVESTLRASGLFRSVTTRLGTKPPDYVLESTLLAMEQLDGGDIFYAHLAMSMRLIRFGDESVVWQSSFDERRPVQTRDVGLTVRALSEIMTDQLDLLTRDMEIALTAPAAEVDGRREKLKKAAKITESKSAKVTPTQGSSGAQGTEGASPMGSRSGTPDVDADSGLPPPDSTVRPIGPEKSPTPAGVAADAKLAAVSEAEFRSRTGGSQANVDWKRSPQYSSDPTRIPAGQGAVFLPALSGAPEREPPVEVYMGETYITTGLMGRRIPVKPGSYTVYFGSGALSQRLSVEVVVLEDQVTLVKPFWSTLEVTVVNETFVPFRAPYELMDMSTREYLGSGYGADQELGEDTQIWALNPGLYKVVQPGASYRSRKNFATVLLMPAAHIPFTLVLDKTTRDFLGAGVTESVDDSPVKEKPWTVQSTVGGDLTWIRRSADSSAQPGTTVGVNFYADNLLRYKAFSHLWTTRFEIEEGNSLEGPEHLSSTWWEQSRSVTSADRVYLNSIYMYELRPRVQPYFRVGAETYLQNRYKDFLLLDDGTSPTIHVVDDNGTELCGPASDGASNSGSADYCSRIEQTKVRLAGPFSPLELKQGAGVNFRLLHNTSIDLDFRLGIGSRQSLQNGRLRYVEESSTAQELYFSPVGNAFAIGPETTLLASGRFTRYFQLTTELDALVPFVEGFANTQYTWRTSSSLRLSSYASLVYVLNLDRNPNVGRQEPLVVDQSLLLRFSFSLL